MSSFCKCISHFFSKNISTYAIFTDQRFNDTLTNDIVSFEQLGPERYLLSHHVTCRNIQWVQILTTLWANCYFSYFLENRFGISCKLSSMETIYIKCQNLFSGKITKNISVCDGLLKILPRGLSVNPSPAEPRYALPLQTVQIQISWLLKKPTDLDLHCLPFSKWIYINNLNQVIWLAENLKRLWHLNLFIRTI